MPKKGKKSKGSKKVKERKSLGSCNKAVKLLQSQASEHPDLSAMNDLGEKNNEPGHAACVRPFNHNKHSYLRTIKNPQNLSAKSSTSASCASPSTSTEIMYVENKDAGNNQDHDVQVANSRTANEEVNCVTKASGSFLENMENVHSSKRHSEIHDGNDKQLSHGKNKPVSFTTLQELVSKEPNEILLEVSKNDCFKSLFEGEDIDRNRMALILTTLGRIFSSDLRQTLLTFLSEIKGKIHFLKNSVKTFLVSFSVDSIESYHLESLFYLLIFLHGFQSASQFLATGEVSNLLPLIRLKCEMFLKNCSFYNDATEILKSIKKMNEYFTKRRPEFESDNSKIRNPSRRKILQSVKPPDNFRSLSILPKVCDIHSEAFLRPNIVKGRYFNTEHYLDVQFRLLREDYVKPLRDAIVEYVDLKTRGKSIQNCKNARVYENASIVKQKFVKGVMYHLLKFTTVDTSSKEWVSHKRFLEGSLLCLSSDDFQTMLFAYIVRRNPKKFKEGLLLIRFEEISHDVLNICPTRSFVIIETFAYFEAYRHNMKALQEVNEDALPFKEYIINVRRDVKHACYLNSFTAYDIRPLLLPLDSTHIKREITERGTLSFDYVFPDECDVGKSVKILDDSSWPCASDMNMEISQYHALKAAVTREFAIIQGPPGTGKTYVGLRIIQLLLHNMDKWFREESNFLPILVVCFSNHALDQFLEGIMLFTDKIVRVGNQGKNDSIYPFQLNNLKNTPNHRQELPQHIRTNLWIQSQQIRSLEKYIKYLDCLLLMCTKYVISDEYLAGFIPYNQYLSLKSLALKTHGVRDDGLLIYDWLIIRSKYIISASEYKEKVENEAPKFENDIDKMDDDKIVSTDENESDIFDDSDAEDFAPFENCTWNPEGGYYYKTQDGTREILKCIKYSLDKSKALEEEEAMKISNVWALTLPQRWSLYKYWFEKIVANAQKEYPILQAQLKAVYVKLKKTKTEEDLHILKRARVVGMTTTGAAKYRNLVQKLNPQILIVEEAAEILESHIVTALAPGTQQVILIGDHQQLRPLPTVHKLALKYGMNVSLFERMIKNKMECFKLSMQHRMRPEITDLIVPHIYRELVNHPSVTKYENIKGVDKNIFFIAHDCPEENERDTQSKSNAHEAAFIIKLCNYLIQQGYDSRQITVLTPYNRQLSLMKKKAASFPMIENVKFAVVDNYQGEENDIILISFVRSNNDGEIGFLKVANRICVALSRARKGLYCIGNFKLLAEKSNLWKNITKTLKQKGCIGQSLTLLCQNHPNVSTEVSNENDFESIPEGGCTKMCDYRLPCGHSCPLICHPCDQKHSNVVCFKKCLRLCKQGHRCPKTCFQECGLCEFLVNCKVIPGEHTIKITCSNQYLEARCAENALEN